MKFSVWIYISLLHLSLSGWPLRAMARADTTRSTSEDLLPREITFQIQAVPHQGDSAYVVEIPFRLSGNLILVDAEINGVQGRFILDSGAPDLLLNSSYLRSSKIRGKLSAQGVTGSVEKVSVEFVKHFKWHQHELKNVKVEAFDMGHIEQVRNEKILGLIGFKFFEAYEILLDYQHSRVILYKLNRSGEPIVSRELAPDHTIPFRMKGHIAVVKAKVAGQALDFGIDTGAEMNVLDIRSKDKVLKHFQILSRGILNGNGNQKMEILTGKIKNLEINGIPYPKIRAVLTSMEGLNRAYDAQLDGIFGFYFLIRRKTAINYQQRKMYLWELQ